MTSLELGELVRGDRLDRRPLTGCGAEVPGRSAKPPRYVLTSHARRMMTERRIRTVWLEEALASPERVERDRVDPEVSHRLKRIPDMEDRVLRVVYNHTAEPKRVISVFFDRRLRGKP